MADPFREALLPAGDDLPERVKACAEPLRDEPAYDPEEIWRAAEAIALPSESRFMRPILERAVRIGLAHIEATFQGDHPKYGAEKYQWARCDGFPPTIISAVDALTLWGMAERAEQLMSYWLNPVPAGRPTPWRFRSQIPDLVVKRNSDGKLICLILLLCYEGKPSDIVDQICWISHCRFYSLDGEGDFCRIPCRKERRGRLCRGSG